MSIVRVDLMASAVGKIGGVTWHHLYLVGMDASGKAEYLRAGPQSLPPEHSVGRKNQYGDAREDYEPSPVEPYGVVTITSGVYEPGGVDFDPVAANVMLASGAAAAKLWEKLQKAGQALQEEQLPYDPVGTGANWALMETLRRCGVEAALPPKRWVPGCSFVASDLAIPTGPTRSVGQAVVI